MNLSFRSSRRLPTRSLLCAAMALASAALGACSNEVGEGVAPKSLLITNIAPAPITPVASVQAYQCLTSALRAVMVFSNGQEGNFSARVIWSSSNPGVVEISNGDIPVPGGTGFYARGVLIGVGAGNATITASYSGITASTDVSVSTPQSIQLKALVNGDYIPMTKINTLLGGIESSSSSSSGGSGSSSSSGNSFTLGQGSSVLLAATALLNGIETDISSFATFGFQVPNPNVAIFQPGTGLLTAINTSAKPLVPVASFAPCSLTNITDSENIVNFTVSRIQTISLLPEFEQETAGSSSSSSSSGGSSSLAQLIVGNTERFAVVANLANGAVQDVTSQSTLTSSDPTVAVFTGGTGTLGTNLLHATAAGGPVLLSATYNNGDEFLQSQTLVTSTRTVTLSSINICWSDLFTQLSSCPVNQSDPVVQAGCLTPDLQFHAFGTYEGTDANGNSIIQDVTRETTWSSASPTVASISNNPITSGQPTGLLGGSSIIQGQDSAAANLLTGSSATTTTLTVTPIPVVTNDPTSTPPPAPQSCNPVS
jgi:hypothetical protein